MKGTHLIKAIFKLQQTALEPSIDCEEQAKLGLKQPTSPTPQQKKTKKSEMRGQDLYSISNTGQIRMMNMHEIREDRFYLTLPPHLFSPFSSIT